MAWRVTIVNFPDEITSASEAAELLRKILSEDSKTKDTWKEQYPEFCNGIHKFGSAWNPESRIDFDEEMFPNGGEYIMIRFVGYYMEAVEAFNKYGLNASVGG